jgi:phosphatidylglycerol:prolipoprotein diacylglycerol transferase
VRPELFRIPILDWPMFAYPTLVALGFALCIWAAMRMARSRGIDPTVPLDIGLLALVTSLLGAHLFYYVEFYDVHFADRPWWAAIAVWEGGLVFYGGVITAFFAGIGYVLWHNARARRSGRATVPLGPMADIAATVIPIGLVFGRIGCFFNGCCWGLTCDLPAPLAVRFPAGSLPWDRQVQQGLIDTSASHTLPVYATQLYEMVASALIFAILFVLWRRRLHPGRVVACLMTLYGFARFGIEGLRSHHQTAELTRFAGTLELTWSQVVSASLIAGGALVWIGSALRARGRTPQAQPATAESHPPAKSAREELDTSRGSD